MRALSATRSCQSVFRLGNVLWCVLRGGWLPVRTTKKSAKKKKCSVLGHHDLAQRSDSGRIGQEYTLIKNKDDLLTALQMKGKHYMRTWSLTLMTLSRVVIITLLSCLMTIITLRCSMVAIVKTIEAYYMCLY